jgi:hypothetical protein
MANNTDVNGSLTATIMYLGQDTSTADANVTLRFTDNSTNANEVMNAISGLSATGIVKEIGAINAADFNGTYTDVEFVIDTNSTLADYSSTSGSHPKTTLTYTVTDEFGKAGTERNITFALNRIPNSATFAATGNLTVNFSNNAFDNVTGSGGVASRSGSDMVMARDFNVTDPDGDLLTRDSLTGAITMVHCTSIVLQLQMVQVQIGQMLLAPHLVIQVMLQAIVEI